MAKYPENVGKVEDVENIEDRTTTSFHISGVPTKVFKRFRKYCEDEAQVNKVIWNNSGERRIKKELCYSIGLDKLLTAVEMDAKIEMIYEKIKIIEERLDGK